MDAEQGQLVVRAEAAIARRNLSEPPVFEALRMDFRKRLPGVRVFGIVALVTGLVLFAAAVVSLLAGGRTPILLVRTLILGAYTAGSLYVAIRLLSDADTLDRALQSGYTLEFEAMFVKKRRFWQRLAAVGGTILAVTISAFIILGGVRLADLLLDAKEEATTRARMERIVAEAERHAIARREYPRAWPARMRDAWDVAIVYAPHCAGGRCTSFRVGSAGPDRRWSTADDIVLKSRVVLK